MTDGSEGAEERGAEPAETEALDRPLPEAVRTLIIEYGSEILATMPAAEIPPRLRRIAKFEPRRRVRLAGPDIAAQLESDAQFRGRVAERMRQAWPSLAEELDRGEVPPVVEPAVVGAVAYVLRPAGWSTIVRGVHAELEREARAKAADSTAEAVAELRARLDQVRAEHRQEVLRLRAELREHKAEIAELRQKLHHERRRAREIGRA
ncbi:RNA-binding protein, partial [Thermobifida cellulosilytica TB100]